MREPTGHRVRMELVKESLTFTGEDSPMNTLLLSTLGAVAEFARSMTLERQREGIALAKAAASTCAARPRCPMSRQTSCGHGWQHTNPVAALAHEYGIRRQSVYNNNTAHQPGHRTT